MKRYLICALAFLFLVPGFASAHEYDDEDVRRMEGIEIETVVESPINDRESIVDLKESRDFMKHTESRQLNAGYKELTPVELKRSRDKAALGNTYVRYLKQGNFKAAEQILRAINPERIGEVRMYGTRKTVPVKFYQQERGYYCCPAACRGVLSARVSNPPSQNSLASQLGTTSSGTDFSSQIAKVINANIGWTAGSGYELLWAYDANTVFNNIQLDIDAGFAVVANIKSVLPKDGPHIPGYPMEKVRHYVVVCGIDDNKVCISDPASGINGYSEVPRQYWIKKADFMDLIRDRGIVW